MKYYILTFFINLILAFTLYGQSEIPDPGANLESVQQFKTQQGNHLRLVTDTLHNTLSVMVGKTNHSFGSTPKSAANRFISKHTHLLGLEGEHHSLEFVESFPSNYDGERVTYQHYFKDIPVLNSGYVFSVTSDGHINYINGEVYPAISLNITPALTKNTVLSIITAEVRTTSYILKEQPELSVLVLSNSEDYDASLVYNSKVYLDDRSEAWEFIIDANDGTVIEKRSLINSLVSNRESPHIKQSNDAEIHNIPIPKSKNISTTGTGKVYKISPNFEANPTTQNLNRLDNLSPQKLIGEHVWVMYYPGAEVTSSTGDFIYTDADHEFDEVMSYYHADEFENWIIGKGLSSTEIPQAVITTRFNQGYAFTISGLGEIYFEDEDNAQGLNNPTREGAVIAHEYMHVISEHFNTLDANETTDAMDEAYSDYFALA